MMGATLKTSESRWQAGSAPRRLVIVADDSLVVQVIHIAFRRSGDFTLVGHANARNTSAGTILAADPDGILLDDMRRSDRVLQLVSEISSLDDRLALIVLSLDLDPDWVSKAFAAGATAAISKETQPLALTTLVRATIDGHIVHRAPAAAGSTNTLPGPAVPDDLPLTPREVEILRLVASGATNGDIGRRLWVTEQTVKFHLRNIYRKLEVANRTEASHLAHVRGLVGVPSLPGAPGRLVLTVAS
jgi:DNA-binding NarL/FixJ family response regulator